VNTLLRKIEEEEKQGQKVQTIQQNPFAFFSAQVSVRVSALFWFCGR
jgi:hypothetical protein